MEGGVEGGGPQHAWIVCVLITKNPLSTPNLSQSHKPSILFSDRENGWIRFTYIGMINKVGVLLCEAERKGSEGGKKGGGQTLIFRYCLL